MRNKVTYEYACEYVDAEGDIVENDFSSVKADVWPPRLGLIDCQTRLALIRNSGNEEGGLQERGYAYKGQSHFDCGHKVPKGKIVIE